MIYLVRHGETEWNLQKKLQDNKDSPLTEKGRIQAQQIGIKLKQEINNADFELFSSPLKRAILTSKIICQELKSDESIIKIENNLREISFGDWEGLNYDEIKKLYPIEYQNRINDKWNYRIRNGESYEIVYQRLMPWITELKQINKIFIIVAHAVVSRVIRVILDPSLDKSNLEEHLQNRIYVYDSKLTQINC